MIKKYLAAVVGLLVLPTFVLATTASDVTLTTDAAISVAGVTFNITGSSATIASITVTTNSFSMDLMSGSTATVATPDHSRIIDDAPSANVSTDTCSFGLSTKTYTATSNVTISVSPSGIICSSGSGYVSSPTPVVSTGSSASPAVVTPSVAPAVVAPVVTVPSVTITPIVPAVVNANPSPVAMLVSPVFSRSLTVGQVHPDAKRLQQLLNSDPDTQVAKSGAGSPGKETSSFGPATKSAVMKFQVKYGVAKPGQLGYGLFGPATRAKVAEVFGEGVSAPAVASSQSSSQAARLEMIKTLLAKILELQAQLKAMQQ